MGVFNTYLVPFLFVSCGNWLQGPYFYDVYKAKFGDDIEKGLQLMYVLGYTAAMVSSLFSGILVDRFGRKRGCICCCALYFMSCLSVRANSVNVLIFGRLFGGVASTLFHTAFESWLNDATKASVVQVTIQWQTTLSGFVAICAGFVARLSILILGPLGPFDTAGLCSLLSALLILLFWEENYGKTKKKVVQTVNKEKKPCSFSILALALTQVSFEAVMHIFIMVWSPILKEAAASNGSEVLVSPGTAFSMFMAALMVGSQAFSRYVSTSPQGNGSIPMHYALASIYAFAGVCLLCVIRTRSNQHLVMLCFFGFEFCCGAYFVGIASYRSCIIPDSFRASVMSWYRLPQNFFVICLILFGGQLGVDSRMVFGGVSLFFGAGVVLLLGWGKVGGGVSSFKKICSFFIY